MDKWLTRLQKSHFWYSKHNVIWFRFECFHFYSTSIGPNNWFCLASSWVCLYCTVQRALLKRSVFKILFSDFWRNRRQIMYPIGCIVSLTQYTIVTEIRRNCTSTRMRLLLFHWIFNWTRHFPLHINIAFHAILWFVPLNRFPFGLICARARDRDFHDMRFTVDWPAQWQVENAAILDSNCFSLHEFHAAIWLENDSSSV